MNSYEIFSFGSSFRILTQQLMRPESMRFFIFLHSKRKTSFIPSNLSSSASDDSVSMPKRTQLGFDPSEELFGMEADLKPRRVSSGKPKPRSWFGPNGQYIRELPCPSCRGRGYTPCPECGIERSRSDCPKCNGKGIVTCYQCLGDCVIWEESIDEQPWEKARSISPLKLKEDDEVDNLDIKLDVKKKSKRIYRSPSPEVGLKISRSLKSLNAKTGLFSKRMKIIHQDPALHAQRVAAIKKAKGTAAARKRTSEALKAFFSDPENRQKRSIAMKGAKFYCRNCGREGHRKHYCPELKDSLKGRQFKCRVCGERGHNRRTCKKSRLSNHNGVITRHHRCRICRQYGHNRRTCPQVISTSTKNNSVTSRSSNIHL
ncbi:zinc knuckle (CCHC-type) family protein [Quillaja saponaria]|uniref:Zinc knuckle (CCHC-type) family protein n=1 Tax=Quillaja saponaria TaxID=32244 RepID=A0AAD7KPS6_QUISA|nr:zinc knuckle (CCHC-type) family protein [Quillaja saponaria]